MRKAPEKSPGMLPESGTRQGFVTEERSYRFISPVFGGGVRNDKTFDTVTPVRVPSIRGQLRFWWRACNPRGCATVAELHRAEAEVFGSTDNRSALVIRVVKQPGRPDLFEIFRERSIVKDRTGLAYGAFALRGDEKAGTKHGVLWQYKDEWKLSFTFRRTIRQDIEAALWAWAHFGGLGGRTRRGFGAIAQEEGPELPSIDEGWKEPYVKGLEVDWPHLSIDRAHCLRRGSASGPGEKTLNDLLRKFNEFRQAPIGRKPTPPGGRHPGRSFWPEPDAIRAVTGTRDGKHKERVTTVDVFPRAAFGLPIIFHFQGKGDPPDCTLKPEDHGRLASPLILRPHSDGSLDSCRPLALVLRQPDAGETVLEWKEKRQKHSRVVRTELTSDEAKGIGVGTRRSPLEKDGKIFTNPIERFLEEIS